MVQPKVEDTTSRGIPDSCDGFSIFVWVFRFTPFVVLDGEEFSGIVGKKCPNLLTSKHRSKERDMKMW